MVGLVLLDCAGIAKPALRDASPLPVPSLSSQPLVPLQGDAGLCGVAHVTSQENHSPHLFPVCNWRCYLVLLCLRGWGKDRRYLPDMQLRALPTQPLINSLQLHTWPLSIHSAFRPCEALGTRAGGLLSSWTELATPIWDLGPSSEPTGMMTPSSFWCNHCFSQNPEGLASYLHFKTLGFKNLYFCV